MRPGDLVFPAPSRGAGGFAQANQPRISMHFNQQKRRDGMRPAASAANGELGPERDADGNRFNAGDFYHLANSSVKAVTSAVILSIRSFPFFAVAWVGSPTVPVFEISWNSLI